MPVNTYNHFIYKRNSDTWALMNLHIPAKPGHTARWSGLSRWKNDNVDEISKLVSVEYWKRGLVLFTNGKLRVEWRRWNRFNMSKNHLNTLIICISFCDVCVDCVLSEAELTKNENTVRWHPRYCAGTSLPLWRKLIVLVRRYCFLLGEMGGSKILYLRLKVPVQISLTQKYSTLIPSFDV